MSRTENDFTRNMRVRVTNESKCVTVPAGTVGTVTRVRDGLKFPITVRFSEDRPSGCPDSMIFAPNEIESIQ